VHRGHRGWQVPDTHEIGSHKPGTAAPNCNPSYSGGSRFKASLDKQFMRPYLKKKKKNHKERAGAVAQGVTPSSNPSTANKKIK
jgi:hypothetical protein